MHDSISRFFNSPLFGVQAVDYETRFVFHQGFMSDLKLSLTLLSEAIEREEPKREREERAGQARVVHREEQHVIRVLSVGQRPRSHKILYTSN